MTIFLLQAPAVHDTVFLVQREPGWQQGVQAFAAVAQIVLAIALLAVGLGVLFAALKVRALIRKVEEQGQKLRVDLAPALHNVTAVAENVNFVSKTVRKDVDRLSASVNSATERLKGAAEMAEQRVGEFNALIGVVQEEAESIFIGGASALRGVQAGATTFRRYQSGELDDEGPYGEDEFDDDDDFGGDGDFDDEDFGDEDYDEADVPRITLLADDDDDEPAGEDDDEVDAPPRGRAGRPRRR